MILSKVSSKERTSPTKSQLHNPTLQRTTATKSALPLGFWARAASFCAQSYSPAWTSYKAFECNGLWIVSTAEFCFTLEFACRLLSSPLHRSQLLTGAFAHCFILFFCGFNFLLIPSAVSMDFSEKRFCTERQMSKLWGLRRMSRCDTWIHIVFQLARRTRVTIIVPKAGKCRSAVVDNGKITWRSNLTVLYYANVTITAVNMNALITIDHD